MSACTSVSSAPPSLPSWIHTNDSLPMAILRCLPVIGLIANLILHRPYKEYSVHWEINSLQEQGDELQKKSSEIKRKEQAYLFEAIKKLSEAKNQNTTAQQTVVNELETKRAALIPDSEQVKNEVDLTLQSCDNAISVIKTSCIRYSRDIYYGLASAVTSITALVLAIFKNIPLVAIGAGILTLASALYIKNYTPRIPENQKASQGVSEK